MSQENRKPALSDDDLSDFGRSSRFEMKPFLAVMIITIAMCILLWNSFRAERIQNATVAAPQAQTQPVQAEPVNRVIDRSSRR